MKITIDKNEFCEKLTIASKFTLSKISSIPALQGGLLKHEDKKLTIIATNLKDSFYSQIKTNLESKFSFVLDIKKIVEFLNLLPDDKIDIVFKDKYLEILSGKTTGVFDFISAKDFPVPTVITGKKYNLWDKDFPRFSSYILSSTSNDESRPVLSGVRLVFDEKETIMVSTDGFRLSLVRYPSGSKGSILTVASSVFREASRLAEKRKKLDLFLSEDKKIAMFDFGDMKLFTQLVEGEFPPYEKVIPKNYSTKITLDRQELLRNFKLASVFARDYSNVVVLDIEKEGLKITPKTGEGKKSQMIQDGQVEGESISVAFNIKFITDFLNISNSETIDIKLTSPNNPALFVGSSESEFLHVIMPIRTDDVSS